MRAASVIVVLLLLSARAEAQPPAKACLDDESREHLRQLMLSSVDDALRDYVKRLFTVWVGDEKLEGQKAAHGMRNAVRAWARGRRAINYWDIPEC